MQSFLRKCAERLENGIPLNRQEALRIFEEADLLAVGKLADGVRRRLHPEKIVTFVVDRNVNYTNVCVSRCRFCAFYRDEGAAGSYLLSQEEICRKVEELVAQGGTQLLMQGGLHPQLGIEFFEELFRGIKGRFPQIRNHSLSPAEISHIARISGLTMAETLCVA